MTDDTRFDDDTVRGSRGAAEVVRSEERLEVATRRVPTGRVRIAKRVVTEERQVTVTVRREELVVEHLPVQGAQGYDDRHGLDGGDALEGSGTHAGPPAVEMWLSEEEVEVTTRVVPKERVRLYVDTVTEHVDVSEVLAKEVVVVDDSSVTPFPR